MNETFHLANTFQGIIEKLKQGQRAHLHLEPKQLQSFYHEFTTLVANLNHGELSNELQEKISQSLCVLDHLSDFDKKWQDLLVPILKSEHTELIVLALGTSQKHVISFYHRNGERVPYSFLQHLEELLLTQDPEVFEWTLRTIETLGGQSMFFKEKVAKSTPGMLKRLQAKWKNSFHLINYLNEKWSQRD